MPQETSSANLIKEMQHLVDQSWQRWLTAVHHMPEAELATAKVCGDWTTKDLMGHVAVWDQVAIDKIREVQEGIPFHQIPFEERNAEEAKARAHYSLDDQRGDMVMTHSRLQSALRGAARETPDKLERIKDWIAEDTWKHYDEHTAQLDAWMKAHPAQT
jgi:hypothetical protein